MRPELRDSGENMQQVRVRLDILVVNAECDPRRHAGIPHGRFDRSLAVTVGGGCCHQAAPPPTWWQGVAYYHRQQHGRENRFPRRASIYSHDKGAIASLVRRGDRSRAVRPLPSNNVSPAPRLTGHDIRLGGEGNAADPRGMGSTAELAAMWLSGRPESGFVTVPA